MVTGIKRLTDELLKQLKAGEIDLTSYLYEEADEENEANLDKSWHAIHFLLNGSVWESKSLGSSIILGGKKVGEEDVGYGPARYFTSEETKKISKYLESISNESLISTFPALATNSEIYPNFEDNVEDREYIIEYFEQLKSFVGKASNSNNCLIVYMR